VTAGTSLVVDSHAFIWYVLASPCLSGKARQVMDDATDSDIPLAILAATLVELVYLWKGHLHTDVSRSVSRDSRHGRLRIQDRSDRYAAARAVSRIPRPAVVDLFDRRSANSSSAVERNLAKLDLDTGTRRERRPIDRAA
jgi:PIN domain nuclease of toxin-antitoxin system